MPCDSDYLDVTIDEINRSQVACIMDELEGRPVKPEYWKGYHPNRTIVQLNILVPFICAALQTKDVTKYSLEMQLWWRDHQAADANRTLDERMKMSEEAAKQNALNKLTHYERHLLGLL